jgi:protein-disulfide isomerase
MRTSALERITTVLVAVAALAVAAAVVQREFGTRTRVLNISLKGPPVYVDEWRSLLPDGLRIGDEDAQVQLIVFADFECPFCRRLHNRFEQVQRELGETVALTVIHFPLSNHRFARPAARAAECADKQNRFAQFASLLYSKQDSLGLKPWLSFAHEAGVRDIASFTACVTSTAAIARIERGLQIGGELNVTGTPTVLINGWRYSSFPIDSLAQTLKAAVSSADWRP